MARRNLGTGCGEVIVKSFGSLSSMPKYPIVVEVWQGNTSTDFQALVREAGLYEYCILNANSEEEAESFK